MPHLVDAAPLDSPFIDVVPRDADLPCGRGVALRWFDAPFGAGVRVERINSAPVGVGALLLWIEYPIAGGTPTFALGSLPTLNASTVTAVSLAPLVQPQWLVPQDRGALVIEPTDTPAMFSLRWALFDETGAGPLQEVSWDLPPGVSRGASLGCSGAAAVSVLLEREDRAVGAAVVQWESATSAAVSEFAFPVDGSLGVWGGAPGAVDPNIEACVASGPIVYALARPGRAGPLRLLRWAEGRLLEPPHALGTVGALGGTAMVDAEGPLFFSFDASEPWMVRAFRPTTGGDTLELDAHLLDAFPTQPVPVGAVRLSDETAMVFYDAGGILAAIGFADGVFGTPTLIADSRCTTQSPTYSQEGHILWPVACSTGTDRFQLGMFELCGGSP